MRNVLKIRKNIQSLWILSSAKKLIEECSELIRAIVRNDDENFIEEMADISVLTDQFLNHFPKYKEKFKKIKQEKIDRQLKRIGEKNE